MDGKEKETVLLAIKEMKTKIGIGETKSVTLGPMTRDVKRQDENTFLISTEESYTAEG